MTLLVDVNGMNVIFGRNREVSKYLPDEFKLRSVVYCISYNNKASDYTILWAFKRI